MQKRWWWVSLMAPQHVWTLVSRSRQTSGTGCLWKRLDHYRIAKFDLNTIIRQMIFLADESIASFLQYSRYCHKTRCLRTSLCAQNTTSTGRTEEYISQNSIIELSRACYAASHLYFGVTLSEQSLKYSRLCVPARTSSSQLRLVLLLLAKRKVNARESTWVSRTKTLYYRYYTLLFSQEESRSSGHACSVIHTTFKDMLTKESI